MADEVRFLEPLDRAAVAERYRQADLFTLPSSAEAFGNVFAEALASGLPIVGSSTGGIPDLVEHGTNGLLVPPGRSACAGLRDPLPGGRSRASHRDGAGNRAKAEATLEWAQVTRRYLSIYAGDSAAPRPATSLVARAHVRASHDRRLRVLAGGRCGRHLRALDLDADIAGRAGPPAPGAAAAPSARHNAFYRRRLPRPRHRMGRSDPAGAIRTGARGATAGVEGSSCGRPGQGSGRRPGSSRAGTPPASSGSTGEPFRVYYEPRAWATLKYAGQAAGPPGLRCAADRSRGAARCHPARTARVRLEQAIGCARISVLQPASGVGRGARWPSARCDLWASLGAARGRPAHWSARGDGCRVTCRVHQRRAAGWLGAGGWPAAFEAPVYDIYGTSETKEIAWECPQGGMHLNTDVVRLEVLDDVGTGAAGRRGGQSRGHAAGEPRHAAAPLSHRRPGALLSETCPCGRSSPLLGVVTGRAADVLVLRGGQRISPYALTCALERVSGVLRYQVSQLDPARVRVRAIVEGAADREAVAAPDADRAPARCGPLPRCRCGVRRPAPDRAARQVPGGCSRCRRSMLPSPV